MTNINTRFRYEFMFQFFPTNVGLIWIIGGSLRYQSTSPAQERHSTIFLTVANNWTKMTSHQSSILLLMFPNPSLKCFCTFSALSPFPYVSLSLSLWDCACTGHFNLIVGYEVPIQTRMSRCTMTLIPSIRFRYLQ